MLSTYTQLGLFLLVVLLLAGLVLALPVILRPTGISPKKPNPLKGEPFECGMETIGPTWIRFNFHYYFFALIFLAIDVSTIFLYLWAIQAEEFGKNGIIAISIFLIPIVIGYAYAWYKGALQWK